MGGRSLFIMQKPKQLLHLDKWREPIPCPGSHTGAADSVPLRTRRRISAQRGLKIRGLNKSAGSGPGAEESTDYFDKTELSFSIKC